MKTRVITAVVALAIFIPLILIGGWPLTVAALALGVVAMGEITTMKKMFVTSFPALVSFLGVCLVIAPSNWLSWLPTGISRWEAFTSW